MKHSMKFKRGILFAASPFMLAFCALKPVHNDDSSARISDSISVAVHTSDFSDTQTTQQKKKKIKIALLLDTSNSMDGLIDQAKAQLWKLVNELGQAKCGDNKPELEIALYEYGNDGLSSETGFIRQISKFTNDLDLISEKLFGLRTNGGSEFCGHVISSASQQLDWQRTADDLQIIFIAGNESFHQGSISSSQACSDAREKGVIVNTIFCGPFNEGLNLGWKSGAELTAGTFMSINHNSRTIYIETPYDKAIADLNNKLNGTYINYGTHGKEKKENQLRQDKNAESYGAANTTERVVSKAGKFYSNSQWDLVDASKQKEFELSKVKEEQLPAELQGKTLQEKEQFVATKSKEREEVIMQIKTLNDKRNVYIAEKSKTKTGTDNSLDGVMIKAIREQASKKNFVF